MRITLDNRVRIDKRFIQPALDRLRHDFVYNNPAYFNLIRLKRFQAASLLSKTITMYDETRQFISFPRGSFRRVRDILRECNISDFEVIDNRVQGETVEWLPDTSRTLDWYQVNAVELAIKSQNCLIRAPTGSGKTTAAIALMSQLKIPTTVIVWTAGLLEQWVERIRVELGLSSNQVSIYGNGKKQVGEITVAMDQTLARNKSEYLINNTGLLICDEVQRFAAKSFREVVDMFPAKYRIGLSADETRADSMEFLIYDQFGSVSYEITQEQVDATGRTVPVNVAIVKTSFKSDASDFHGRTLAMMNSKTRNDCIVDLAEQNRGKQTLIFLPRVEHCRLLERMLINAGFRTGLALGGVDNKVEYKRTIDGLLTGETEIGIGTVEAIGTGIDLPSIEVAIVGEPIANNIQLFNQVRGRICRGNPPNKTHATIFYLWDRRIYPESKIAQVLTKYEGRTSFIDKYEEMIDESEKNRVSLLDGIF